jgi:hypothetical protein
MRKKKILNKYLSVRTLNGVMQPYSGAINRLLPSGLKYLIEILKLLIKVKLKFLETYPMSDLLLEIKMH